MTTDPIQAPIPTTAQSVATGPEVGTLPSWLGPYAPLLRNGAATVSLFAVLAPAFGLLIAGPHFASAGVPAAKLPLILLTATGFSFFATTVLPAILMFLANWAPTQRAARATLALGLPLLIIQLSLHLGFSFRSLIYFLSPLGYGHILAHAIRDRARVDRPRGGWHRAIGWALSFLISVILLNLFSSTVYPALPAELGGGRPKRVHLEWAEPLPSVPDSSATYEVFRDDGFIYLAVEPVDETSVLGRLSRQSFPPGTQHFAIPISKVRSIAYLPWATSWAPTSVASPEPRSDEVDGGPTVSSAVISDSGQPSFGPDAAGPQEPPLR